MQTITVPAKTFEKILSRLDHLSRAVEIINEKLEGAPPYGSDEWWEWSDKKAKEDIKKGRYVTLHSAKEVQEYLDSLKTTTYPPKPEDTICLKRESSELVL